MNNSKKRTPDNGLIFESYINRPRFNNSFKLKVYDTRSNMQSGMERYYRLKGFNKNNLPQDVAGVVFEDEEDYEIDNKGFTQFAVMFLNECDINADIIAHECVHATFVLERNILKFCGLYDGNDGSGDCDEERFAYTLGSFVNEVTKSCIKYKVKLKFVDDEEEND